MARRSPAACAFFTAALTAAQFCAAGASGEVCRFTGTTSHDGHVAVTASVEASGGATRVDVALAFDATWFWLRFRYLVEEITTWRDGRMQTLAVNTRYLVGDRIIRQQWDAFRRGPGGLEAQRVQAKTLADFRRRHPGFVQHWDPATFGSPWLQDYPAASPERRADLDLQGAPDGLSSPLAMAFYRIRWLPRGGDEVPVFLPGFKADKLVNVPVGPASSDGEQRQAVLRYPVLSRTPASTATAVLSPDGHLLQLAFDVHEPAETARGVVYTRGCEGSPVKPAGRPG
nr:hypothetical protein [uncultured Rhodopila sp.]